MGFIGNQFRYGGQTNLTLSGATRTLTSEEAFHRLIIFDSATTNCTVTIPNVPGGDWIFYNGSAHTITLQTTTGDALQLPAGSVIAAYCDGDTGMISPFSSPPRIGYVTPAPGYFTTVTASGLVLYTTPTDPANDAFPDYFSIGANVTGTSTDATTFSLTTYSPDAVRGASGVIEFVGGCRNLATNDTHVFRKTTGFKLVSGTVTVGETANPLYNPDSALDGGKLDIALDSAVVVFDASGGSVRVRATGIAATNLSWWGRVTVWSATVS